MELNKRQLDVVHRLRCTYAADNGHAHDALIYYLLSDGGQHAADIGKKIKKAMTFYKSVKGERFYHQISDHLSREHQVQVSEKVPEKVPEKAQDDEFYDYSREMAKAAKNKNGHLMLTPGSPVSPEKIALQALSNFSKTI